MAAQPRQAQRRRVKQQELKVEEFGQCNGMETREQRDAIQKGDYSWLMNIQPVGRKTLRFLNGKGATLYTAPGGKLILWFNSYIIGTTYYFAVFLNDGTADQVAVIGGAVTHISATPGTFWSGTGQYPHFTGVAASGVLIVSPLGYWAWDGTTLYAAGAVAPSWVSGLTAPIIATGTTNGTAVVTALSTTIGLFVGMGASAADITAGQTILSIDSPTQITLSAVASGSHVGETITFSPQVYTGTTNGTAVITGLSSTVGLVIGMGASATDITAGQTIKSIDSGTQITLSAAASGSNTGETITFYWNMPSGVSGTAIEIYNATPWIVNGRTIIAAAPANGATFATSAGGVSLPVKDAYVQDGYSGLKQLDGFLYLFAHGAIDVISDVSTSGTPPSTTFLRVNVSPKIGTPWRDTIVQLPSSIAFANPTGCYEVSGGQARKISPSFDGIFENATYPVAASDPSGYHPSAFLVTLSEAVCYGLTLTINDPDTATAVHALGMWDGQRWFLATQETQPIIVGTQDSDSVSTGWGSDATTIYQMFAVGSLTLAKKAKSWFSAGQSGLTMRKMLERLYAQFGNFLTAQPIINVTVDTERLSVLCPAIVSTPGQLIFTGNNGVPIQFQNNSSVNINFVSSFYPLVVAGSAPGIVCVIFGLTFQSSMATLDIVSLTVGYIDYSRWE